MVENLLDGIEVRLNTEYLENKEALDALAEKVIYTGSDRCYFGYELGTLEYRSVRFETELLDQENYQGKPQSIIQTVRHHGLVLLSINGLSLEKIQKEMTFQRL